MPNRHPARARGSRTPEPPPVSKNSRSEPKLSEGDLTPPQSWKGVWFTLIGRAASLAKRCAHKMSVATRSPAELRSVAPRLHLAHVRIGTPSPTAPFQPWHRKCRRVPGGAAPGCWRALSRARALGSTHAAWICLSQVDFEGDQKESHCERALKPQDVYVRGKPKHSTFLLTCVALDRNHDTCQRNMSAVAEGNGHVHRRRRRLRRALWGPSGATRPPASDASRPRKSPGAPRQLGEPRGVNPGPPWLCLSFR